MSQASGVVSVNRYEKESPMGLQITDPAGNTHLLPQWMLDKVSRHIADVDPVHLPAIRRTALNVRRGNFSPAAEQRAYDRWVEARIGFDAGDPIVATAIALAAGATGATGAAGPATGATGIFDSGVPQGRGYVNQDQS